MNRNNNSQLLNNKGMTLLEIMIVLAILGGLITILAGQVTQRLAAARVKEAKIQIAELGKALDMFYTDCGFYPEGGLEELVNAPSNCPNWGPDPYLKKVPKDPWGNDYDYQYEDGSYVLFSYGEDRKPGGDGTAKDI
ncbi:MAG: type II secretion system major pseudopilin GspG, partial [Bdellovibrionales bacterium]|nr:type II secretion system major pseudopilin GspG [Bdellovibrionales bacterium]